MEYNSFLLFLSQIAGQKKAKVVVQGSVIFVETNAKNNQWSLSTKILHSESRKSKNSINNSLTSGFLKWQERGAYLRLDKETQALYLIQEVTSSKKYLPFKYLIQDFAAVASEWKEIFEVSEDPGSFIPHVG